MWKQKKLCIENGNSFICISKTTQQNLKSIYGIENSYLVYNAFDPSRFAVLDDSILKKLNIHKPYFLILPTNNDEYKNIQLVKKLLKFHPEILDLLDFVCLSEILLHFPVKAAFQISDAELTSLYSQAKVLFTPPNTKDLAYLTRGKTFQNSNICLRKLIFVRIQKMTIVFSLMLIILKNFIIV